MYRGTEMATRWLTEWYFTTMGSSGEMEALERRNPPWPKCTWSFVIQPYKESKGKENSQRHTTTFFSHQATLLSIIIQEICKPYHG